MVPATIMMKSAATIIFQTETSARLSPF